MISRKDGWSEAFFGFDAVFFGAGAATGASADMVVELWGLGGFG